MLRHVIRAAVPALVLLATSAGAQVTTTVTSNGVSGTDFGGSLSVLNDGVYPPNGTLYTTNTVSNFASSIYFNFAFTSPTSIAKYNLNVDNNDNYTVTFYNGASTVGTYTILASDGVVGSGVETFTSSTTLPGTYLSSLALTTPVTADHVRITASVGDGLYSIGEAEFFAAPAVPGVPEPAAWAMMIGGFALVGAAVRRRGAVLAPAGSDLGRAGVAPSRLGI